MPDLPDVEQDFVANVGPYIAAMQEAAAAARDFAEACGAALECSQALQDAMGGEVAAMGAVAAETEKAAETTAASSVVAESAMDRWAQSQLDAAAKATEAAAVQKAAADAIKDAYTEMVADIAAETAAATVAFDKLKYDFLSTAATAQEAAILARGAVEQWKESLASLDSSLAMTMIAVDELQDGYAKTAEEAMASAAVQVGAATAVKDAVAKNSAINIGWWRLSSNAIHWIIAGTTELLAVVVPAIVAAGAWAAVWAEGAGDVYTRMTAVYDATEALGTANHETAGQVVGLGHALQTAQTAADPQVFEALGGMINIVKESAGGLIGVGTQLGIVFDKFLADLVLEFHKGGTAATTMQDLLKDMEPDLVRIGEVFGNLGRAIAGFASQMPGLAEVLLHVLEMITRFAADVIDFAAKLHIGGWSVLTFAIALEEFNRWGSLTVGLMGRMGMATAELSGSTGSYFLMGDRFIGIIKNLIMLLPAAGFAVLSLASKIPLIGAKLIGTTEDVDAAGAAMKAFVADLSAVETVGIALIGVALAYLVYHFVDTGKAAQQYANSIQNAVNATEASKGAFGAVSAQFSAVQSNASKAAHAFASMGFSQAAGQIKADMVPALGDLARDTLNTAQGAQYLAEKYHTNLAGAMAMATAAGVKLTTGILGSGRAAQQARQMIADYVQGMLAMGAGSNQIASDVNAIGLQSALAATKLSTLNQAWDSFMQGVTGGTGDMAEFQTSLANIGQVIGHTTNNLGEATVKLNANGKAFAQDLTSYTGKGAAAWTNFDQIVGSTMPSMADWFRQAGAEGAISGKDITKAILDMSSEMVPFAEKSKTAQAELVAFAQQSGDNIKNFQQLKDQIKDTGANEGNLSKLTNQATIAMSNLSQIAKNMSDVMNAQADTAISNAALKTSGYDQAVTNLTNAIKTYGANSPQAVADAQAVTRAWDRAQAMANEVARGARNAQSAIDAMHGTTIDIGVNTVYSQTGVPGPGAPGGPRIHAQHGGVIHGRSGIDRIPAMLSAGEGILTARAVAAMGGPQAIHALNSSPQNAVLGVGGHSGGGSTSLTTHIVVELDGSKIATQWRTEQLTYNRRNNQSNTSLRVR
jgi:hypothetical protein